jgi:3-oxoacyl-[acyl-carrier protein] reductase
VKLQNKIALVTGGGRGIGEAIAVALAKEGASVIVNDIDKEKAQIVSASIRKLGIGSTVIQANVAIWEEVERVFDKAINEFGQIDILVNNAGIPKPNIIEEITTKDWNEVINVNLSSVFFCCKAAIPHMKRRTYGRIINISSLSGRTGRVFNGVGYSASKAGIIGLTMCLAREVGPYGITVNAVAPGPIYTETLAKFPIEIVEKLNENRALERKGKAEDIANAVMFLASDDAEWITGQVIDVNGGIYM